MAQEEKLPDPNLLEVEKVSLEEIEANIDPIKTFIDSFLENAIYGSNMEILNISQEEFDKEILTKYINIMDFISIYVKEALDNLKSKMKEAISARNAELAKIKGYRKKEKSEAIQKVNDLFNVKYYLLRNRYSFIISGYSNTCEEDIFKTIFLTTNLDVAKIKFTIAGHEYSFLNSDEIFDRAFYSSDDLNNTILFPFLETPLIPAENSTEDLLTWDTINKNRLNKKQSIYILSFHSAKIIHYTFSKVFSKYMTENSVWKSIEKSDNSPIKLLHKYLLEYKHPFVPQGSQRIDDITEQNSLLLEQDESVDFTGIAAVFRVGIFYDDKDIYESIQQKDNCPDCFKKVYPCVLQFTNDLEHLYDTSLIAQELCDFSEFEKTKTQFISHLRSFFANVCSKHAEWRRENRFADLFPTSETFNSIICFDTTTINELSVVQLFNESELSCFAGSTNENAVSSSFSLKTVAATLSKLITKEHIAKYKVSEFLTTLLALLLNDQNRVNDNFIQSGKIHSFFSSLIESLLRELELQSTSVTFNRDASKESIATAMTKVVTTAYFEKDSDKDTFQLKLLRKSLNTILDSYPTSYKNKIICSWSSRINKKDKKRTDWDKTIEKQYETLVRKAISELDSIPAEKRKRLPRKASSKKKTKKSVSAKEETKEDDVDEEESDEDENSDYPIEYVVRHDGHDDKNLVVLVVKYLGYKDLGYVSWSVKDNKTNSHLLFYIDSNNELCETISYLKIIEVVGHNIAISNSNHVRKLILDCKWSDKPNIVDAGNNFSDDVYVNYSIECRRYVIARPELKKEFMPYLRDEDDDDIHRVISYEGMFSRNTLTLKVKFLSGEEKSIKITNELASLSSNKVLRNPFVQSYCHKNLGTSKPLINFINKLNQSTNDDSFMLENIAKSSDKCDQLQIHFSNQFQTIIDLTVDTDKSSSSTDIILDKVRQLAQNSIVNSRKFIYETINLNTEDNDSDNGDKMLIDSNEELDIQDGETSNKEAKKQALSEILHHFDNEPSLKIDFVTSFQNMFIQTNSPWRNIRTTLVLESHLFNNIIKELSTYREKYCPNNSGETFIVQNSHSKSPGTLFRTSGFSLNEVISFFENKTNSFNMRLLESFINAINCNELQFYNDRDENKVRTVVLNVQVVQNSLISTTNRITGVLKLQLSTCNSLIIPIIFGGIFGIIVIDICDKNRKATIWQYLFHEDPLSTTKKDELFERVLHNLQDCFKNTFRAEYLTLSNCDISLLNSSFVRQIKSFKKGEEGGYDIQNQGEEGFDKNCNQEDLTNYKMTSLIFVILSLIKINNKNGIESRTYDERISNIFEYYLDFGFGIYQTMLPDDIICMVQKSLNDFLLLTLYYVIFKKDIPSITEIGSISTSLNPPTTTTDDIIDEPRYIDGDEIKIVKHSNGRKLTTLTFTVEFRNNNNNQVKSRMATFEELNRIAPEILRTYMDKLETYKKNTEFTEYYSQK